MSLLDGLGLASNDTVVQEEDLKVNASRVLRFRDPRPQGCESQDKKEMTRVGLPAEPLPGCGSTSCRQAGWNHDGSTRQPKESSTGGVSGLPRAPPHERRS